MREYKLTIAGHPYTVAIIKVTDEEVLAEVNGVEHTVTINDISTISSSLPAPVVGPSVSGVTASEFPVVTRSPVPVVGSGLIYSPIPGHILEVSVAVGDKVLEGQKLLVLEAMKLENIITAQRAGVVKEILVRQGDAVTHGQAMIEIA